MNTPDSKDETIASPESISGLDPWRIAELPEPPRPRGLSWFSAVGPGVIVLGASIGSGEFLLGPAAFVKYGLSLLWIVGAAAVLQTLLNVELMRYTLATGEPIFTGFMRTKPSSTFWAWFYSIAYFVQMGWPGWAGAAAGAVFFLVTRRLPNQSEAGTVYLIGVSLFLLCGLILTIGRRIERTLEYLNWVLVALILGGLGTLAVLFVPAATWGWAIAGFGGFDIRNGTWQLVPSGADFFLLGAFAGYAGGGGVVNLTLTNWARDKGYGMSKVVGYIPAAVGGTKVALAHTGSTFEPTPQAMTKWRGWWRIIRVDQWGVYFTGVIFGMMLPGMLYVTFVAPGRDIRGLGIAAELANAVASQKGAIFGGVIAILGVWILFKTQLDILEGMTRAITDILWTGSSRIRAWRGGDVRIIYYVVLVVVCVWGIIALRLTQPIILLALSANMAGLVMVFSSLHLIYVNSRLLPVELRPPLWRKLALVALSLFYGFFVTCWLWSLV
jgi:Mn2+/Fe2+ NRAMP family transporter